MEEASWTTSYCLDVPGFPKILYDTMTELGATEHPVYTGREFVDFGTERCEVTVQIPTDHSPGIRPWSVTATGFHFPDTYQLVARKALKYVCQLHEKSLRHTSMRYFPLLDKHHPSWRARMDQLEEKEGDPTVVSLTRYLLALDELFDKYAANLRSCIQRAEDAEEQFRVQEVHLAEARAQAAETQCRATKAEAAIRSIENRHARALNLAYLTGRAHRQPLHTPIVEGHPVTETTSTDPILSVKRKFAVATLSVPTGKDNTTAQDLRCGEILESVPLTQQCASDEGTSTPQNSPVKKLEDTVE